MPAEVAGLLLAAQPYGGIPPPSRARWVDSRPAGPPPPGGGLLHPRFRFWRRQVPPLRRRRHSRPPAGLLTRPPTLGARWTASARNPAHATKAPPPPIRRRWSASAAW